MNKKRDYYTAFLGFTFPIVGCFAQDTCENKANIIKEFYQEYCRVVSDSAKVTSLITQYCTDELRNALLNDLFESSIGGYDYVTNATYEYELVEKTVSVSKDGDHYVVNFDRYNSLFELVKESIIIILDDKGKIAFIKKIDPEFGYTMPEVG
ncbi:MAG: hypothetical protein PHC48_01890 [Prevotella sp.]|nr:hypothetical protein [Prevotella sp.]